MLSSLRSSLSQSPKRFQSVLPRRTFKSTAMAAELPKFNPAPAFKFVQSPNPNWKFGEGLDPKVSELAKEWVADEQKGWKSFTLQETHGKDVYMLLTSSVIPRPIAFVSTVGADGVPNLAPMSYFSLIAHDPPMVGLSFALWAGIPKNTRDNILATKEFSVSLISEPFLEAANACSIDAPIEIDEWQVSGLTPVPSDTIKPAWVKESGVSLECELFQVHNLTSIHNSMEISTTFVMGTIKKLHVRNSVLGPDGVNVDPAKLRAVSRLGGFTYARVGEGIDLGIPMWSQNQEAVSKVLEQKANEKK